jgi:hypothetical protein
MCIETTQGNSLCSYLYLKPAKNAIFLFLSFVFSSTKSENRRADRVLCGEKRSWHWWKGEVAGEGVGG